MTADELDTLVIHENIKSNYSLSFRNDKGQIGELDFSGPLMVFHGEAEESAKVLFDYLAKSFSDRFEESERTIKAQDVHQPIHDAFREHEAALSQLPEPVTHLYAEIERLRAAYTTKCRELDAADGRTAKQRVRAEDWQIVATSASHDLAAERIARKKAEHKLKIAEQAADLARKSMPLPEVREDAALLRRVEEAEKNAAKAIGDLDYWQHRAEEAERELALCIDYACQQYWTDGHGERVKNRYGFVAHDLPTLPVR